MKKKPKYLTEYNSRLFRERRQSLNLKPEHFASECQEIEVNEKSGD